MSGNILITGGAGFIGRWLVDRCLKQESNVVVYDSLVFGKVDNLNDFSDRISFYQADILDHAYLGQVMKEHKIETVFHLAAYHYIPYCNAHPLETIRVNVEGTVSVIKAAIDNGAKRFILASTGAIYKSTEMPLSENTEVIRPSDIYGLSKLLAEQAVRFYAEIRAIEVVIARFFNAYGPYETNPHLIPDIIQGLKTHRDFVTLGNIETKRDYIYVEDVADALITLLAHCNYNAEAYNVATGQQFSAKEIVETIEVILGHPIEIRQETSRMRKVDKAFQLADIDKIKTVTGWSPRYQLIEGLDRLLSQEHLRIAEAGEINR